MGYIFIRSVFMAFGIMTFIFSGETSAGTEREAIQALQTVCRSLEVARGRFTQVAHSAATGRQYKESGWFAWVRPDHLRWVYKEPEAKDMVWDGDYLGFYIPEDCVVYEENDTHQLGEQNPFIGFIRNCTPGSWKMHLIEFTHESKAMTWKFQSVGKNESRVWETFVLTWQSQGRRIILETRDGLSNRVVYELNLERVEKIPESTWDVRYPEQCERMPFTEHGK